jgi:hypothetical protein
MANKDQFFSHCKAYLKRPISPSPPCTEFFSNSKTRVCSNAAPTAQHRHSLAQIANNLLLNDTLYGVLWALLQEVGESCNLTAISGSEVMNLDCVKTPAPLRLYLYSGSKVPVHCMASSKLF